VSKLKRPSRKTSEDLVEQVRRGVESPAQELSESVDLSRVVSTGSTLLDLAISGGRRRGGGIPGGIIVEIYGSSGSGKTAILAEVCASAQYKGGQVKFLDPEARLDQEYCRIYGLSLQEEDYGRPDTVTQVFDEIWNWEPEPTEAINVIATDSLAALSTEMEMEDRDKMGMRRAKEFSEGLRKTCRIIANNNWLVVCTNQVREGDRGEFTPGGKGIPFYSSLRIRVAQKGKIVKAKSVGPKKKRVEKVVGIHSECFVSKSTVDDPFRRAPVYIVFGLGIDDVRANLQWLKDMTGATKYECFDKGFVSMDAAIRYIEEHNLQRKLREEVIGLWEEIEQQFRIDRKPKERW
jgi:RecA/RadA recombinase